MQAAEKESVILECEVDEEDAKVVWKKDGEVFKPADKKSDCNQLLKLFSLDILNALFILKQDTNPSRGQKAPPFLQGNSDGRSGKLLLPY